MDDVEIMVGLKISNEEIYGLEIVDDSGEGSVMSIMENINDDTSLDTCKVPTTLEEGFNSASGNSPASKNYDIEAKNDCTT